MHSDDPATIKADLLAAMRAGHDAWDALIAQVDPTHMTEPGVEGNGP